MITTWSSGRSGSCPVATNAWSSSYFELKLLFANLPKEELSSFTNSLHEARGLFAPLLFQRYPYVGHPTWIDDDEEAASTRMTEPT